jgi:hypothetical protein
MTCDIPFELPEEVQEKKKNIKDIFFIVEKSILKGNKLIKIQTEIEKIIQETFLR